MTFEPYKEVTALCKTECPSCGSDGLLLSFKIGMGAFSPVIGVCYSLPHAWPIHAGTHVWKYWQENKKSPEDFYNIDSEDKKAEYNPAQADKKSSE